ncbi:hypothetical protein P7K49_004691 [Saguinus oedipus]|uniref:Uncharacterized protein n=1 Tax=Saguinus oedipus TaxID=9490 RepID=A0ABQ9W9Q6_SAGOE|nr:hypothetical protein P7K49_004691 [Saguinus oedipus]
MIGFCFTTSYTRQNAIKAHSRRPTELFALSLDQLQLSLVKTWEAEAMKRTSTLEELSWRHAGPEPHIPWDLNREQAWAWAMDNFPALSRHSCQCHLLHRSSAASWLLHCASGRHRALFGDERDQKRRQDTHVQKSLAETTNGLQSLQEDADATDGGVHSGLKLPGDASACGGGRTHAEDALCSQGRPRKLLKTQDSIWKEPEKERITSLSASLQHHLLQPLPWKEPEARQWGPSFCPCGLLRWYCSCTHKSLEVSAVENMP